MTNKILEQIEKELQYAAIKYPCQNLTKHESITKAMEKLRLALDYKDDDYCKRECTTCIKSDKFTCYSFAAIAILIRGIETELKETSDLFKKRDSLFYKLFRGKIKDYK